MYVHYLSIKLEEKKKRETVVLAEGPTHRLQNREDRDRLLATQYGQLASDKKVRKQFSGGKQSLFNK